MSVTLLAVMAAMVLLSYIVLNTTVAPAFDNLELAAAEKNIVRAKRAIQNDMENLAAIVGDWAPWDDAYAYALGKNPGFEKSNLDIPTMTNLDLDLLLVYDAQGKLLWSYLPYNGETADPDSLEVFDSTHPKFERLVYHTDVTDHTDGLLLTGLGPMLMSSRPIIRSAKEGPIVGTMIMGQFLDSEKRTTLRERTEVSLTWHLLGGALPVDASLRNEIVAAGAGSFVYAATDSNIQAFGLLADLFGEPLMILQADTPRQISALGGSTVNGALMFLSAAGIVVAIVTWLLLRRIIVLPLERLANHITGIRESGDLSLRLNEERADEIGALAGQFDRMTLEVHDARRQLLDQSFKAGKADTAAEVLHNIRNAMTPLINGIDRLSKNFRFAGGLHIQQATEELADPACHPDRRGKLLQYIGSAFGHIQKTSEDAVNDLQVATRQAKQVEAILSDQERFANVAPIIESLELHSIIEEASLVIPNKDKPGIRLDMRPELKGFVIQAHRVGLVQVLGNLILNGYESIQRSQADSGSIDVSASLDEIDGQSVVRVTVRDSGCGFGEELKHKIFQRGFSSKQGHLSGLGLHWCANALAGMGGRVSAESAGPDCGAAFHVLLPGGIDGTRTVEKPSLSGRSTPAVERSGNAAIADFGEVAGGL
ncbi:MAG: CHASE4 domain-containing protein [Woeseia sp.]